MNRLHIVTILLELSLLANIIITLITRDVSVLSFVMVSIVAMLAAIPPNNRGGGRYA